MSPRKRYRDRFYNLYSHKDERIRMVPPGERLAKELHRQHITQKELAVMLGRSEKFISQLVTGKVRLTYDVSYDLWRALKVSTSEWNRLEADYQEELTWRKRFEDLHTPEVAAWVEGFPYEAMVNEGMVPETDDPSEKAYHILNYFGVATPDAYECCCEHEEGLSVFKARKDEVDQLRQ